MPLHTNLARRLCVLACGVTALMLCACNLFGGKDRFEDYILDDAQIYTCTVDGKPAYVVSINYDDCKGAADDDDNDDDDDNESPVGNEGRLYIDEGELFADPIDVILQTRHDSVFISGDDVELQPCDLEPLAAARLQKPRMVPLDYCTPRFTVNVKHDVVYAHADGYWASYPETFEDFGKIFMRKFEHGDLLFRRTLPLTMDIYEPADTLPAGCKRPLMVMIHGGGFFNGDKADEEYRLWCRMFAECGYTAVSINYRMGFTPHVWNVGRAAYRAAQDARAAVGFLLEHQEEYSIDPERIFMAGCSAGAITALNAAFMKTSTRPEGCGMIGEGLIDHDLGLIDQVAIDAGVYHYFSVRAIGNMWGGVFDLSILQPSGAKIYSIQSVDDPVVPANTDYPFKVIYGKAILLKPLLEFLTPKLSGSLMIEGLHREGDQFLYFTEDRHTLIRYGSENHSLNERHKEFFKILAEFFRDNMLDHPARLGQYDYGGQTYAVFHMFSPMEALNWKVEGGVITDHEANEESDEIKVLFFSDAHRHRITVDGMYKCGLKYSDTLDVK